MEVKSHDLTESSSLSLSLEPSPLLPLLLSLISCSLIFLFQRTQNLKSWIEKNVSDTKRWDRHSTRTTRVEPVRPESKLRDFEIGSIVVEF